VRAEGKRTRENELLIVEVGVSVELVKGTRSELFQRRECRSSLGESRETGSVSLLKVDSAGSATESLALLHAL
jgi:hypothetical protein